jgi:phage terminase large subunit-like protein
MTDPGTQQRLLVSAMKRLESIARKEAFDPFDPSSRPTASQQEVIDEFGTIPVQFIVAGNQSGKSQMGSRLVSWFLDDSHPTWKHPAEWRSEPLLILVCGRTGKQIEESLLPKIRSYLDPGTFKEVRVGNMIQRLEMENGNRIVFQSLENPNIARERLQSYVAHLVWIDEQPPTDDILDELLRRVQARGGLVVATFTPLVENLRIQRRIDSAIPPYAKKYHFRMLDNPVYQEPKKREKIIQELAVLPESIRNTRLYGHWSSSNSAVYSFDYDKMVRSLPEHYNRSWRHVESVDPALKSALGLGVFAEDPQTGHWYLVHSEEISGIHDPEALISTVSRKVEPYNIMKRISDPHEVWYIQLAARRGMKYIGVYNKNSRKGELIKQLQELGSKLFICPHNTEFIDQLLGCRWADGDNSRIISASSKHMLDMAQYFCDNIPKYVPGFRPTPWFQKLYEDNDKRLALEQKGKDRREHKQKIRMAGRRRR